MARLDVKNLKANVGNAQKVFLWEVIIPNPIGGGNVDALRFRAQTAQIPGESIGSIHIDHGNSAGVNFTGRRRIEQTFEMTFIDGEDLLVYRSIRAWMNVIHGNGAGAAGDINSKSDLYLYLIGSNDTDTLKLRVSGAFPLNKPAVSLNYTEDGVVTFSLTFQFDDLQEV